MKHDPFAIRPVPRGKVRKNGRVFRGRTEEVSHVAAEGNACLYAFGTQENEYVKIGYSKCPGRRLRDIQTGSPFVLFLLFYIEVNKDEVKKLERAIHSLLPEAGGYGRGEWWAVKHDKVAEFFISAAREMGIEVVACAGGADDTEPEFRKSSVCARNGGGYYKP